MASRLGKAGSSRIPAPWLGLLCTLAALFVSVLLGPSSASALSLQEVGSFDAPTFVTSNPGDPNRLFIVEQDGVIRRTDGGGTTTFLDIAGLVRSEEGEQGLFSMAFAPDYESSGLFYVFYTSSNDPGTGEDETGDLKIAESIPMRARSRERAASC
jgi:hypothetical protein